MKLVSEFPVYVWLLCLVFGAVASWWLYRKGGKIAGATLWELRVMSAARFVWVTLISFLLLSPFLNRVKKRLERPVLAIAIDQSASVLSGQDSLELARKLADGISVLQDRAGDKMDLRVFGFGSSFYDAYKPVFRDKETNLGQVFTQLSNRFVNRNLGAVVLVTDGVHNTGQDPMNESERLNVPVFTVALGDTTVKPDLAVRRVTHNPSAYLGNTFPIEIFLEANALSGKSSSLKVSRNGQILYEDLVGIQGSSFFRTLPVQLQADKKGMQHYVIEWAPIKGEVNMQNNQAHVYIEVIENKQKILFLSDAPHPDVSAIRQVLEKSGTMQSDYFLYDAFTQSPDAYSVAILHGLPKAGTAGSRILAQLINKEIPRFVISGEEVDQAQLNAAQNALTFSPLRGNSNEVLPEFLSGFSQFSLAPGSDQVFASLPPVKTPYGSASLAAGASVMLKQRIGTVRTEQPLFAVNELNGVRTALLLGEGIWRWRMVGFLRSGGHAFFEDFIKKTIQYLAVRAGKNYFRIEAPKMVKENEEVLFHAFLFDPSYEPLPGKEIRMEISDASGKKFDYVFSPQAQQYRLNAGVLPPGDYTYRASVDAGHGKFGQSGSITVAAVNLEFVQNSAQHALLRNLAKASGGKFYYTGDWEKLADSLLSREDLLPVSYTEKKILPLLHEKWYFFVILFFMALEWFLRKRSGAY